VFSGRPEQKSQLAGHWPVSLTDDELANCAFEKHRFIIGVGQIDTGQVRERIYVELQSKGLPFATLVAAEAYVSRHASLGAATLVGQKAVVCVEARIGENTIVNTGAIVEHGAQVGNHVHVSTGAIVNGECQVGDRSFIGSGSVLKHGVRIGEDVVIGAGAVVTKDIVEPGTYVGIPARRLEPKSGPGE
jgi:sugar O-acyltransferase (sialic acid O-acetyltransferase NeuD family)